MAAPLEMVEILTTKEDWAKVDTSCEVQPWCHLWMRHPQFTWAHHEINKQAKYVMDVVRWLVEAREIGAIKSHDREDYAPLFFFDPSCHLSCKWIDNNLDSGTIKFNEHPTSKELVVFITLDYGGGQVKYYNRPLTPKQLLVVINEVKRRLTMSKEDRALFGCCEWKM